MKAALLQWSLLGLFAAVSLAGCSASQVAGSALPSQAASQSASHAPLAERGYKVLFSFGGASGSCSDGAIAWAPLTVVNGKLYGTTTVGGADDGGTAYQLTLNGSETVLHSFASHGANALGPSSGLTVVGSDLYGTTLNGGAKGDGTIFSVAQSGKERLVYQFGKGSAGDDPEQSNLVSLNGTLYGTTSGGGKYGGGTLFSIASNGAVTVLHNFGSGADGANPLASLLLLDGTLYGTTVDGGSKSNGTVFSVSASGGERVLHSFGGGSDGTAPRAGLVAANGLLYGTTTFGGAYGDGTLYSITTGGNETVLHSFGKGTDGRAPQGDLVDVRGAFYGTTSAGGKYGSGQQIAGGTIFSFDAANFRERVLHNFSGSYASASSDGLFPTAGLVESKGVLYGTTTYGGSYSGSCLSYSPGSPTSYGTVFALKI